MVAPSKGFTVIADAAIDTNSPITVTLMTQFRDNDIHLEEWLGGSYVAAVDHDHNGLNSKALLGLFKAGFWFGGSGTYIMTPGTQKIEFWVTGGGGNGGSTGSSVTTAGAGGAGGTAIKVLDSGPQDFDPADVDLTGNKITLPIGSERFGNRNDDIVRFVSSDTLPAPLVVDTNYYVVNWAATEIQLSLTKGGAAIVLTSQGAGVHTLVPYGVEYTVGGVSGTSSFGVHASATGGGAGSITSSGQAAGGNGGVASNGDVNLTGGDGQDGYKTGAGDLFDSLGGASVWGGGGFEGGGSKAYGSGGGGNSGANQSGGSGRSGLIWLREYA